MRYLQASELSQLVRKEIGFRKLNCGYYLFFEPLYCVLFFFLALLSFPFCSSQRSLRVGVEVSFREDGRNVNGCDYCLLSRKHFVLWKIYLCATLTFIIINQAFI